MGDSAPSASAPSGWVERAYARAGSSPVWVGAALAAFLVALFLATEVALGRHHLLPRDGSPSAALREVRLVVVQCLLAAYVPTAYVVLLQSSRRTLDRLRPVLRGSAELDAARAAVGRYGPLGASLAAAAGLAVVVAASFLTTPRPYWGVAWSWGDISPEVRWNRALSLFLGFWLGRLLYAVTIESRRLSEVAARLGEVDLLDLRPLAPFTRQALTNALLVVLFASILVLFLVDVDLRIGQDAGFVRLVLLSWVATGIIAGTSVVLPMRGVRRRIREAKESELAWCRAALREGRDALERGEPSVGRPLDQVAAWEARVAAVREWPFDASSLLRFALYLMIPLGSWAGGALVERAINALLD